jgi:FKBP-type peptidyl-prolyl cis-trans isomerase 2
MVRDRQGLGWLGKLIVLVVLASVYIGAVVVLLPPAPSAYAPPIAESGDFVSVNYRGYFPDNLRTFDTSLESVAKDNATFPKAASFTYRSGQPYEPLTFELGCTSGSGCPLAAFQNAVRGLRAGEFRNFELTPTEAYGPANPAKIHLRNLTEDVVATEAMDSTAFQQRYGEGPVDGSTVPDSDWGWNVTVHVSGNIVTVRHSPVVGQTVTVAGKWQARVLSIDDGANEGLGLVRVEHFLRASDVRAFVASDRSGNFLVTAVDPLAQTFTTDYNSEVIGRNLSFSITLVSIQKTNP